LSHEKRHRKGPAFLDQVSDIIVRDLAQAHALFCVRADEVTILSNSLAQRRNVKRGHNK
jgi:hypothetical protein